MGNGWGNVDKAKEGNTLFIKLKDGESIQCVPCGEPYTFYQAFQDKREFQDYVDGASFRFKLNVAVLENGAFTMKILNGGVKLAKSIRKLLQKLGPNTLLEIEREGSTKDNTTYHVIPMGQVSPEQLKTIASLKLNSLQSTQAVKAETTRGASRPSSDNPFADDDYQDAREGNY